MELIECRNRGKCNRERNKIDITNEIEKGENREELKGIGIDMSRIGEGVIEKRRQKRYIIKKGI